MANDSVSSTSPEVEIRPATEAELDAILALAAQTLDHHVVGDPHVFEPVSDPAEERARFSQMLHDTSAGVLVAILAGRPVGYAVLIVAATPSVPGLRPRRVLRVEDLGVDKEHRRAGIGRRLMDEALAQARSKGLDAVELNVFAFNEGAISLYQSLGYQTTSLRMRLVVSGDG